LVSTWHEHCSHALNLHEEIAKELPDWPRPAGLRTWLRVTQDPLSRRVPGQPDDRSGRCYQSRRTGTASPTRRPRPGRRGGSRRRW
jgi:hypothetical protein